jgi:6-phosphofructokinase 1
MAEMAVDCIANGQKNLMIAGWDERLQTIPLGEVVNGSKTPELGMFELARVLSI